MAKRQTIKFNEFMDGSYNKKVKKEVNKLSVIKKAATSISIPLAIMTPKMAFASSGSEAVTVGAKEWMGEQTLSALAHVLDPVIDILVALSFPIASVVIVGACFFFMFGNSEKAWSMIQNAGLGYVLIQVSPLILEVLKQVGNAV
jgi:hypothetical protein